MAEDEITIIGGGLAGSEAAWQMAVRGFQVTLYEMRPTQTTEAHVTDRLAELVCSNSLGSKLRDRATGLLQHELRLLKSKLIECADASAVPAGGALAVDRELFADLVTGAITKHPNVTVVRQEVSQLPETATIVATGPLTAPTLSQTISQLTGQQHLYFYDAISPIVTLESIDMSVAFHASRYQRGDSEEGDYINCPMNQQQYDRFVDALCQAETIALKDFEREDPNFFEGCMPIEQLAKRGPSTLAFGPMRPKGLHNPHTNKRPYAVVQLRKDNLAGSLYNLVGFQTNIRWSQQQEILRMIPGLEAAEFVRFGQMHRNTFINAPTLIDTTMQFRQKTGLFFAGQITGVEGYVGNIATGIVAAVNLTRQIQGQNRWIPPKSSMIGALCHYITHADPKHFQPMKANFGILPPLDPQIKNKRARYAALADHALNTLSQSIRNLGDSILNT